MIFGFDDENKFYIEYSPCSREVGTLRQEAEARAREIYQSNEKIILCLSSGLDSQVALHSFISQKIPVECAFLRLDGFNENEYENFKFLEKKYGFKAHIININPNDCKDELIDLSKKLDTHPYQCLQRKFIESLPSHYDIVQVLHDPWIITNKKEKKHYMFHGFYDPEISRYRTLCSIPRSGKIQMFGDSTEFFLSLIDDELFHYFLNSWNYYDKNGLTHHNEKLPDELRYDYYIKPMLYAKHWKNELIYFPKFSGWENIDWLLALRNVVKKEKMCFLEYNELIDFLKNGSGIKKWGEISLSPKQG